jgi:hypothetical protein
MYKVCCVVVGIVLFLPLWALAQPAPDSGAGNLAAFKGRSRPLLIFYPQPAAQPSMMQTQRSIIAAHPVELKQRNVVPIYIPLQLQPGDSSTAAWRDLRSRFHIVDKRFTVLLLGTDGGEKLRSHAPVTIEELDALIDDMPMRQQEMRDGRHTD